MKLRFDILGHRKWFFSLSCAITITGLLLFLLFGFNLGTDFKAGSQIQLDIHRPFSTVKVEQVIGNSGVPVSNGAVTVAGMNGEIAMIRFPEVLSLTQESAIAHATSGAFPNSSLQVDTVDPLVAEQTSQKAILAVLIASLCIAVFITFRFEYRFSVAAIIALLHDAFIVMSVFVLLRLEVNLTFVAAVLTIIGYSINDTIVIFDRIRENLKQNPPKTHRELHTLVNESLWQTMRRSLNTVATVLIAAFMLFFFGGQSIHSFTFALSIGLISGAYSSIFIAAPLWAVWYGRTLKKVAGAAHAINLT